VLILLALNQYVQAQAPIIVPFTTSSVQVKTVVKRSLTSPGANRFAIANGKVTIKLPADWNMEVEDTGTCLFYPSMGNSQNALRLTVFTFKPKVKADSNPGFVLDEFPSSRRSKTVTLQGKRYMRTNTLKFSEDGVAARNISWWIARRIGPNTFRIAFASFNMPEATYASAQSKAERGLVAREVRAIQLY
jgi:hypothetical protein